MKLTRLGLSLLFLLLAFTAVQAQVRGNFEDAGEGFLVARAIEANGDRTLLVKFPSEYLTNAEVFAKGTSKALTLVMGCAMFKDCTPVPSSKGVTSEGLEYVIYETIETPEFYPMKLMIFIAGDGVNPQGIGIRVKKD